jgi:hypothetical protein
MEVELEISLNDRLNPLALLTDEELWNAAQTQASEDDNHLMQDLLDNQQRETLEPQEVDQLQQLSQRFNDIVIQPVIIVYRILLKIIKFCLLDPTIMRLKLGYWKMRMNPFRGYLTFAGGLSSEQTSAIGSPRDDGAKDFEL